MRLTRTIGLLVVGLTVGALLAWFATRSRPADLERRIEAAEQRWDHAAIQPMLEAKAQEYETAAAFHRRLAARYGQAAQLAVSAPGEQESSASPYSEMAAHCTGIAENLEKAASQTRALAQGHQRLAESQRVETGR
jgi:uncharacterized membrane-anchored protein YhcB (DUF1043 family)